MKKNLINEIHRISELIGSKSLISEQAVPKFLKSLLNVSDDIIKKVLKSSDTVSDDVLRKAKAGETLSDEAVELLLRNIDFNQLAKIIIDEGLMGSQYLNKIDDTIMIIKQNPDQINIILNKVDNVIDGLPFLSDGPDKLVKAIKSETRDRIMRGVSPETSHVVDDIFNNVVELLDDVPAGSVSDKIVNITSENIKKYEQFLKAAKEKGSVLQTFTQEQFNQAVSDLASNARRMDPNVFNEFKLVYAKNPGWWKSMSLGKKIIFVSSLVSLGPAAAAILYHSLKARFTNWGDIAFIKKIFEFNPDDIEKLTQSNVKKYLIDNYTIDVPSFNKEYKIHISNDKTKAIVRGPRNFKVSILDKKIIAEET